VISIFNRNLLLKVAFCHLLLVCSSSPARAIDGDEDGVLDIAEGMLDADQDGVENYRDIDADNDGILDSVESGGLGDGSAAYPDFKEYRPDGLYGFATADANFDGKQFIVGTDISSGTDGSNFVEDDMVLFSMNSGAEYIVFKMLNIEPGVEVHVEFKGAGSSPKFEMKGVGAKGSAEESATIEITQYDPADPAFATAIHLGEVAKIIQSGLGSKLPLTTSISIGDLDDEDKRREGVGAEIDSLASWTVLSAAAGERCCRNTRVHQLKSEVRWLIHQTVCS